MLALRIPVVFLTRPEWLAMLLLIGVFGFTAQVRCMLFPRSCFLFLTERLVPVDVGLAARDGGARHDGGLRAGASNLGPRVTDSAR